MTVQDSWWSWQENPRQPDPKECSPLLSTISRYLRDRWGGADLGCYARRDVVGGSVLSSHASGAATDWRYENPGPGRSVLTGTIIPWLLNNSRELGVTALHDYAGDRIWRPPGSSGRPSSPSPDCGWRKQNGSGGQMGQAWATWIHVECLNTRWSDTRTVEQMLGSSPQPPPVTPTFAGDDMPRFIGLTNDGKYYVGDQIQGRQIVGGSDGSDKDKADQIIKDADRTGTPLFDLKTGKALKTVSGVEPTGGVTSRIGKTV